MNYEINVSFRGAHYFATDGRSLHNEADAKKLLAHFREVFPRDKGYCCELRRIETRIYPMV